MRRFAPLLFVIAFCIPIWLARSSSPMMLRDSDTAVLLGAIRERGHPFSWFLGDWPLGNHFYRPVSTLFFELDNKVYGADAGGYGATQALIAILCVLALHWFVRELWADWPACFAASLFAIWHLDWGVPLSSIVPYLAAVVFLVALFRRLAMPVFRAGTSEVENRGSWRNVTWEVFLGPMALFLLSSELGGHQLRFRMIEWLPGRTASVMTLFGLLSLAAYARFERLTAKEVERSPSPYDLPATKSTGVWKQPPRHPWLWALLSCVCLALALGSYEQAVMLPSLLLGVAVVQRLRGSPPKWIWQAAFWGILVGYLVLRRTLVSSEVSGYQAQQFRDGPGVWLAISDYLLPAWRPLQFVLTSLDAGIGILFLPAIYLAVLSVGGNLAAVPILKGSRVGAIGLGGFVLSVLAFLPMAWLKHFDHYHYLPLALRTIFVVALGTASATFCLRALSPPAVLTPGRAKAVASLG